MLIQRKMTYWALTQMGCQQAGSCNSHIHELAARMFGKLAYHADGPEVVAETRGQES